VYDTQKERNDDTQWLMANFGAYWSLADNGKLEISHT